MHQQSDRENPTSDASRTTVEDAEAVEIDRDTDIFSDISLPDLVGRYIGDDGADDTDPTGPLGASLVDRILGSDGERVARENPRQSQSQSQSHSLWRSQGAHADGAAAWRYPTESLADRAAWIAHLVRMVGGVASREVTLDESHRPPPDAPEYDARRLLVAAYNVLANAEHVAGNKKFAKSKFSRLAAGIRNNLFSNWTKQFERCLHESSDFWAQLGFGEQTDARATIDHLEALYDAGAPSPTAQDLIASPLYRKLSFVPQCRVTAVERRTTMRTPTGVSSNASTAIERLRALRANSHTALPRIVTAWRSRGGWTDGRGEVDGFGRTRPAATTVPTVPSVFHDTRYPATPHVHAAARMALYLRILGSVASREVIPDESHRPPPDALECDARTLLVAAYNALSRRGHAAGASIFSKNTFSRLAVGSRSNRFSDWTKLFENHLGEANQFWTQLGFGEWRDAQATIEQLEALYDIGASMPTVQDLIDSPFYRRLSFIKQSGVTEAERGKAKRARLAGIANVDTTPVSRIAEPDRLSDATEVRGDAAARIADLIRILGSVANRDIRFDESHRPPPDGPEYDARCLLVAAYNMLSKGGHTAGSYRLSKRHFNRLAVQINSGLFNLWTLRLDEHLNDAMDFWAHFGLGDAHNAQATIDRLEALQDAATLAPTVQDLIDSPLYRTLSFSGQNRMDGESLKYARRESAGNASAILPSFDMSDPAFDAMPWSQIPVSFDALGESTQSRPDASPRAMPLVFDQLSRRCGPDFAPNYTVAGEGAPSARSSLLTPPPVSIEEPGGDRL